MVAEPDRHGRRFQDVTVPPYDARLGFLLPPLVMEEAGQWLHVNAGRATGAESAPFAVGGHAFLPRTSFRVRSGASEKLVLLAFEPEGASDPSAGVEITSLTEPGRPAPGGPIRYSGSIVRLVGRASGWVHPEASRRANNAPRRRGRGPPTWCTPLLKCRREVIPALPRHLPADPRDPGSELITHMSIPYD